MLLSAEDGPDYYPLRLQPQEAVADRQPRNRGNNKINSLRAALRNLPLHVNRILPNFGNLRLRQSLDRCSQR